MEPPFFEIIGQGRVEWNMDVNTKLCYVDISDKVCEILEPSGFECYPFKVI